MTSVRSRVPRQSNEKTSNSNTWWRCLSNVRGVFRFFEEQKVKIHLVKDKIDTSTAQGRLMFQIMGAFAEFERETIRERLQAGKKYAEDHGTKSGKPQNRPRKEINMNECIKLYKAGLSLNKLGKHFNVHALTIKSRLVEKGLI